MIAVASQGTQESREAARRVMARIPGAVEIAPGSWRHRPDVSFRDGVKLPPVTNAKAVKSIAECNQHQGQVHSAKNAVNREFIAGESQQQLVMFSEVSHVG